MIYFVSNNYNLKSDLVGVDIGTAAGYNAFTTLMTLPIKMLYLIDPYLEYDEFKGNVGFENVPQSAFDDFHKRAVRLLYPFKDRTKFVVKKSEDAIDDIPGELDFVYIDGNHEYEYVKRDVELYYPRLKKGGIFGGDNFEPLFPGVVRAVLEFTDKYGLKIHGGRSPVSVEWWVIKK